MSAHQNNSSENGKTAAQLKAASEILEKAVGNRALLGELSEEERTRLLTAAGAIYCPDVNERRRLVKATVRRRKAEKIRRDESKLNQTGIRKLRREKVFTTPNVLSAEKFPPARSDGQSGLPRSRRAAELLHLQKGLFADSSFLRPALSGVRGIELAQAHRDWPICAGAWHCSPADA